MELNVLINVVPCIAEKF